MNDLEVVSALFAALEAGEAEAALELVHRDVKWAPVGLGGSEVLRGEMAARGWFAELGRDPGRIHVEVRDIFRLGEWVVALGTVDDNREGLGEASPVGWNLKLTDGLVREAHGYGSWGRALEMAGGWIDRSHPHRAPSPPCLPDVT